MSTKETSSCHLAYQPVRLGRARFIAALPDDEREAVLGEVRALVATDPDTRDRAQIELPYKTDVYWARSREP